METTVAPLGSGRTRINPATKDKIIKRIKWEGFWFFILAIYFSLKSLSVKGPFVGWEHGGFSIDDAVRIAGDDRAGLERLLRYCARPAFALEWLTQVNPEQVLYRPPKPQPDGRTALSLTPLEPPPSRCSACSAARNCA